MINFAQVWQRQRLAHVGALLSLSIQGGHLTCPRMFLTCLKLQVGVSRIDGQPSIPLTNRCQGVLRHFVDWYGVLESAGDGREPYCSR